MISFRSWIFYLKGFTEKWLDGALEDDGLTSKFVEIINKESERLHHLVIDLLELSQIKQNKGIFKIKPTDLEMLINTLILLKVKFPRYKVYSSFTEEFHNITL